MNGALQELVRRSHAGRADVRLHSEQSAAAHTRAHDLVLVELRSMRLKEPDP
jgi:hypothetical protein